MKTLFAILLLFVLCQCADKRKEEITPQRPAKVTVEVRENSAPLPNNLRASDLVVTATPAELEAGSDEYYVTLTWLAKGSIVDSSWTVLKREGTRAQLSLHSPLDTKDGQSSYLPLNLQLARGKKHEYEMRILLHKRSDPPGVGCPSDFLACPLVKTVTVDLSRF